MLEDAQRTPVKNATSFAQLAVHHGVWGLFQTSFLLERMQYKSIYILNNTSMLRFQPLLPLPSCKGHFGWTTRLGENRCPRHEAFIDSSTLGGADEMFFSALATCVVKKCSTGARRGFLMLFAHLHMRLYLE